MTCHVFVETHNTFDVSKTERNNADHMKIQRLLKWFDADIELHSFLPYSLKWNVQKEIAFIEFKQSNAIFSICTSTSAILKLTHWSISTWIIYWIYKVHPLLLQIDTLNANSLLAEMKSNPVELVELKISSTCWIEFFKFWMHSPYIVILYEAEKSQENCITNE